MKICVLNADSFVGSNFCNYLVQYTKYDVIGVVGYQPSYAHLQAAISSKGRFSYQFSENSIADKNADARIKFESPDVILVIDQDLPNSLVDDKRTIYVGRDYNHTDSYRQFLFSDAFGPRKSKNNLFTKEILGQVKMENPRSALYIKDLFDETMAFVDGTSRFASASAQSITQQDIDIEIPLTKVQVALAHTKKWYEANQWFNL